MRLKTLAMLLVSALITLSAAGAQAGTWDATIKLGGIYLDEDGDLSTVQETYNIHDGFSVSQILVSGSPANSYFKLDLREINLDGRQATFLYRRPGLLRVNASYDQHRQVFDPRRAVSSDRKDLGMGARFTPNKWLRFSVNYNNLRRDGDRLSFPTGTLSALGTGYDYTLNTASFGAEVRKDRRGLAVDYRVSDFIDDMNTDADRTGKVVSARVYFPGFVFDEVTHMFRGAYGVNDLPNRDLDYTLQKFQYTGVVRPFRQVQLKYNFDAQRIESQSTDLQTDRFQNVFDATYYHGNGSVSAGYGYETNDDDESLTTYQSWRAGASFRNDAFSAKVRYAGRVKDDDEDLTLLKDVESSRYLANVELTPAEGLVLGAGYNFRERVFPDIRVQSEGNTFRTNAGYSFADWGRVSTTYTNTHDEYQDLAGGYEVLTQAVTARVDFERIRDLRLSGGLTYLDIGKDLDIEKSILFFESMYTLQDDIHLEVKYNVYNYDDYILLDRYYTANVVWFNIAYDLHGE